MYQIYHITSRLRPLHIIIILSEILELILSEIVFLKLDNYLYYFLFPIPLNSLLTSNYQKHRRLAVVSIEIRTQYELDKAIILRFSFIREYRIYQPIMQSKRAYHSRLISLRMFPLVTTYLVAIIHFTRYSLPLELPTLDIFKSQVLSQSLICFVD